MKFESFSFCGIFQIGKNNAEKYEKMSIWNACECIIAPKKEFVNPFFLNLEKIFQKPLYKSEKICYNNAVIGK